MASITLFLKNPTPVDKKTPIIARLAHGGIKTKIYLGISIEPRQWQQDEQLVKSRGNAQAGRLNLILAAMRTRLENCFLDGVAAGFLPTAEQLRQAIEPEVAQPERARGVGTRPEPEAIAEPALVRPSLLDEFIAWNEQLRGRMRPATLQTNTTCINHLRGFMARTGYLLAFDTLTPAFDAKFCNYLLTVPKLTDNAIAKNLIRLNCFLRYAHAQGLTERRDFERLKWKHQTPDILVLTRHEVQALEQVELTDAPALANARDLFLLACYTGLRYSDLVSVRPEHRQGNNLRLRAVKTRELVTIPLRPASGVLLDRLFAGEVHNISNQKLNDYLKEVGQRAQLNTLVERVRYRSGRPENQTFTKWQLLTCHTARRTFVTLALEQGIPNQIVMQVSGHKTFSAFSRYINLAQSAVTDAFEAVYGQIESVPPAAEEIAMRHEEPPLPKHC
ncbi:site-specific integrase [Hymenobacter antarcticus]|uniref:Site-specific integrase n=1 Tax=Hymenobacter antarcticus TaxID=486270 RepID=A0ABP7PT93_9BACT